MRRWIGIAFTALVLVVGINDLGRFLIATTDLDAKTREVAYEATRVAHNAPGYDLQSGWLTAAAAAKARGIEVTGYSQDGKVLVITSRTGLAGTWAIGPAYALVVRQPLRTPFPITGRVTSRYAD